MAGALLQTSVQVASTTGVCLSALLQTVIEREQGLLAGLRAGYWLLAGFCWLSMPFCASFSFNLRWAYGDSGSTCCGLASKGGSGEGSWRHFDKLAWQLNIWVGGTSFWQCHASQWSCQIVVMWLVSQALSSLSVAIFSSPHLSIFQTLPIDHPP